MKYSILLLFTFFSCSIFSQTESNLNILLDRLQENHMGSVSDVFSPEEQQILRAHFDELNENNETTSSGDMVYLYGPNNSNHNYLMFLIRLGRFR